MKRYYPIDFFDRSSTRNEFLCPLDRTAITIPPQGMDSFPVDPKSQELISIKQDLERTIDNQENADLDINIESLNKGVKDIEHSSAMAQHEVNLMFENIQRLLKKRQDNIIHNIRKKSRQQISLLEFQKFRLVEVKKCQSEQQLEASQQTTMSFEDELSEPFNTNPNLHSINTSTPPSITSFHSNHPNSNSNEPMLTLSACHIGQQQIEFLPSEGARKNIAEQLEKIGKVVCDFDLKVKLDRNLLALDEFPFGMKIGGKVADDEMEWQPNQPIGRYLE